MDINDEVIKRGVRDDALYVGRLFRDISTHEDGALGWIISFCAIPYLSLFLHEARAKPTAIDPAVFSGFSADAEEICARARHSLKLFEDTKRGIEAQLNYFEGDIRSAHADRFLNNTWLKPAKFLECDLGLYKFRGETISTTHAATFHLGVEPRRLLEEDGGPYVASITQQYGEAFAKLGATFDSGAETFVRHLTKVDFTDQDKRSSRYYKKVFNGDATAALNGVLTGFQAMMNFAASIITAGSDASDLEYTVFKIRYLALYTVLASLRLLHDDPKYPLTHSSHEAVRSLIDHPDALLVTDGSGRPFRNTLMHYNLVGAAARTHADLGQPVFGLVPLYFPAHDFESFSVVVDRCVRATARGLNEWAQS
ncbi:hypothetical protein ACLMNJ_09480 [Streptomyces seoulensis]